MPGFFEFVRNSIFIQPAEKPEYEPHQASKNIDALARNSVHAWRYECEKVLRGMRNSCKYIVNSVGDGYISEDYAAEHVHLRKIPIEKMSNAQLFALMAYKTLTHYLQTCHETYNLVAHEMITGRHLVFATQDARYAKEHFGWAPRSRGAKINSIMHYLTDFREADYLVSQNRKVPDGMIIELYERMHEPDIFTLQAITCVPPDEREYRGEELAMHKKTFFTDNSGSRNFILHLGMRMDQLPSYRKQYRTTH